MNRVFLSGRVTRDPELRSTAGGRAVAQFSVETVGDGVEATEFTSCVAWDKLAETVGRYVAKGQSILVDGRLQTRQWDDDHGVRHWKTEVVATGVELLSGIPKPAKT